MWQASLTRDFSSSQHPHVCLRPTYTKLTQVKQTSILPSGYGQSDLIYRAGIHQDFFTHFKTNTKSIGICRLLRCCVLLKIKYSGSQKWAWNYLTNKCQNNSSSIYFISLVMGDSWSEGGEYKSHHRIPDGHFCHKSVLKIGCPL